MKLDELYQIDKDLGDPRMLALKTLLRPIVWSWSSSIGSRQKLVRDRHKEALLVKPFMNELELRLYSEWNNREAHNGLWD